MLQVILIRGEERLESVQTVHDNECHALKITTMALSFMYSTGTRVCLFNEIPKQVNSVVIWMLLTKRLMGTGFHTRKYDDLGLSM